MYSSCIQKVHQILVVFIVLQAAVSPQEIDRCSLWQNGRFANFSYVTSISVLKNGNLDLHFCGGVLVRQNWVLTAFSCFQRLVDWVRDPETNEGIDEDLLISHPENDQCFDVKQIENIEVVVRTAPDTCVSGGRSRDNNRFAYVSYAVTYPSYSEVSVDPNQTVHVNDFVLLRLSANFYDAKIGTVNLRPFDQRDPNSDFQILSWLQFISSKQYHFGYTQVEDLSPTGDYACPTEFYDTLQSYGTSLINSDDYFCGEFGLVNRTSIVYQIHSGDPIVLQQGDSPVQIIGMLTEDFIPKSEQIQKAFVTEPLLGSQNLLYEYPAGIYNYTSKGAAFVKVTTPVIQWVTDTLQNYTEELECINIDTNIPFPPDGLSNVEIFAIVIGVLFFATLTFRLICFLCSIPVVNEFVIVDLFEVQNQTGKQFGIKMRYKQNQAQDYQNDNSCQDGQAQPPEKLTHTNLGKQQAPNPNAIQSQAAEDPEIQIAVAVQEIQQQGPSNSQEFIPTPEEEWKRQLFKNDNPDELEVESTKRTISYTIQNISQELQGQPDLAIDCSFSLREMRYCKEIGSGGYGVCCLAWMKKEQTGDFELVVVKVLKVQRMKNDDFRNDFEREVRHQVRCSQEDEDGKFVVRIKGVSLDVIPAIVMEYIEGGNLKDFLLKRQYKFEEQLQVMISITKSVWFTHSIGVLQNDIQPTNILVRDENKFHMIIGDFGIAHLVKKYYSHYSGQTIHGHRYYAAPERQAEPISSYKSDVFSLGLVMIDILIQNQKQQEGQVGEATENNPNTATQSNAQYITGPCLVYDDSICASQFQDILKRLVALINICVADKPENRPSAQYVLNVLEDLQRSMEMSSTRYYLHKLRVPFLLARWRHEDTVQREHRQQKRNKASNTQHPQGGFDCELGVAAGVSSLVEIIRSSLRSTAET